MVSKALALLSLLPLTSAHFQLTWPPNRGFNDEKATNFPCGGYDSVSSSRTDFPLSGGPIQLNMEHTQTKLEVLLAVGSDPGNNYNVVLRHTVAQEGLGKFCFGEISVPSGLNVSDGTPATIQVVSNGDPAGGLYQCADVTLRNTSLNPTDYGSHCANGTGVKVTQENIQGNPNETTSATKPSASASPTQSGAAQTASHSALASHPTLASWLMGAVAVAGFALL